MEKENNKSQQKPASRRSARLRFSSAASVISSKINQRDPNNTKADRTLNQPYFRTKLIDGRRGWVECDGCAVLIRGIRFKCMSCADFDLCHRCSNKGWHAEHEMRRIVHPKFVAKPMKKSVTKKEPATGLKMKKPQKLAATNKKAKRKPTKANEKKGREQNKQKAGNGGQEEQMEEEQMEMAAVNTNDGEEQQQEEGEGRTAIKTEQASEEDHALAAVLQKASNVKMEVGN